MVTGTDMGTTKKYTIINTSISTIMSIRSREKVC
jgi:hypothetical protein